MRAAVFTRFKQGSIKQLSFFSLPLILSFLSLQLPNFCDRLFLARYAVQTLEACAAAGGLILMFQVFVLRITSITQAFVAEYIGSQQEEKAIAFTWQMIWFSLLIMILLIPLGKGVSHFFFRHSETKELCYLYFNYLLYGLCLLGVESTLGSFYSGIGRTRIVFVFHLTAHLLNVVLNYFLIYGFKTIIPEMGLEGAALGTVLSKGVSVLLFFILFVRERPRPKTIRIDWTYLKQGIHKGLPRSLGHMIGLLKWNIAAYIMIKKGGDYLLAMSYGSSLFFPFISEGISQGTITVASYLKGARIKSALLVLLRSSLLMTTIGAVIVGVPLCIFPHLVLDAFIQEPMSSETYSLLLVCSKWLWVQYLGNGLYLVAMGFVIAFGETWFFLKMITVTSILSLVPIYYFISMQSWNPYIFWVVISISPLVSFLILFQVLYTKYFHPSKQILIDHVSNKII